MGVRLVVGLGNPGKKYEGTRHNVGFEAVDLVAGPQARWQAWKDSGLYLQSGSLWLAKPQTYMNLSGEFVQAFSSFYKIPPAEILLVSDDMDLPLGALRIRKSGSSGGQRGLESVLERLGTREVPRLRLGIGRPPAPMDGAGFVLGRFAAAEKDGARAMVERAAKAVEAVLSVGVEAAMNVYNKAASE